MWNYRYALPDGHVSIYPSRGKSYYLKFEKDQIFYLLSGCQLKNPEPWKRN